MSVFLTQPTNTFQGKTQVTNYQQGPSYQMVGYFPPSTSHDEMLKKLHEMEQIVNDQGNTKLSYGSICNDPIHPFIPIKYFPHNFEVPKMDKFKGKEDPEEHIRQFKCSCYILANDDVLMSRKLSMNLVGKDLD